MARRFYYSGLQIAVLGCTEATVTWHVRLRVPTGQSGSTYAYSQRWGRVIDPKDSQWQFATAYKAKSWIVQANNQRASTTTINSVVNASGTPTFDSWLSVVGGFSLLSGHCQLNASGVGTATGLPAARSSNYEDPHIGIFSGSAGVASGSGDCAGVGVWSTVLADQDCLSLYLGFCELLVCLKHLVMYWPLGGAYGNQDRDRVGNAHLNPIGSPTWTEHPKTIYPCECLCC